MMVVRFCNTRMEMDEHSQELTEHGSALFPIACYEDDLSEGPVPWRWHPELELALVAEGCAVVGADAQRCTLQPGDGCFINANAIHGAWRADGGPCVIHSIVFHPKLVGGAQESIFWRYLHPLMEHPDLRFVPLFSGQEEDLPLLDCIRETWLCCASEPYGYEFSVRSRLSELVLHLNRRLKGNTAPMQAFNPSNEARVKAILDYIRTHLTEEITIAALSRAASVSQSECIRCFKAVTGTTPLRYVNQLRLQRAAELLTTTEDRIIHIGMASGFQDMSCFARRFRAQFGVTPQVFRKNHRDRSVSEAGRYIRTESWGETEPG